MRLLEGANHALRLELKNQELSTQARDLETEVEAQTLVAEVERGAGAVLDAVVHAEFLSAPPLRGDGTLHEDAARLVLGQLHLERDFGARIPTIQE